MVVYHITEKSRLASIMEKGLELRWGLLSQMMDPDTPVFKVYFFRRLEKKIKKDMDDWLSSFYRKEDLVLLEVTLPEDFSGLSYPNDWEVVSDRPIPGKYIRQIPFPDWESLSDD